MRYFRNIIIVILAVLIFLGPGFTDLMIHSATAQPSGVNPPKTSISLKPIVEALLNETPADANDTDNDGLPDLIELVIGTDPNNADSDFDRLEDYQEIDDGLEALIIRRAAATDIAKYAMQKKMYPMKIDGYFKALRGLTSIDEVLRATAIN